MNSLHIAILSIGSKLYSTRRIREAALQRGHKVRILNTKQFGLYLEPGQPDLIFRGKPVQHFDAIVPRIGNSMTFFGTAVVRQFQQICTYYLNTAGSIMSSRDKLASLNELSTHYIGVAGTAFVR